MREVRKIGCVERSEIYLLMSVRTGRSHPAQARGIAILIVIKRVDVIEADDMPQLLRALNQSTRNVRRNRLALFVVRNVSLRDTETLSQGGLGHTQ